jgi:hypothetical protein
MVLATGACSAVRVSTDYDPAADLGALRTYEWKPKPEGERGDPRVDNSLMEARVRRAVDRELRTRGFTEDATDPDFRVGYDVVLEQRTAIRSAPVWYGPWSWGYAETYSGDYERTVLILDFTDPRTGEILWRGTATGNLIADDSPDERERRVRRAVDAILARFPPDG